MRADNRACRINRLWKSVTLAATNGTSIDISLRSTHKGRLAHSGCLIAKSDSLANFPSGHLQCDAHHKKLQHSATPAADRSRSPQTPLELLLIDLTQESEFPN
jgi:hypothetical protein